MGDIRIQVLQLKTQWWCLVAASAGSFQLLKSRNPFEINLLSLFSLFFGFRKDIFRELNKSCYPCFLASYYFLYSSCSPCFFSQLFAIEPSWDKGVDRLSWGEHGWHKLESQIFTLHRAWDLLYWSLKSWSLGGRLLEILVQHELISLLDEGHEICDVEASNPCLVDGTGGTLWRFAAWRD